MATPQGNFVAYQPLKPVEYKVGDLYEKWIGKLVDDNKAKEAAKAKALQKEHEEVAKRLDKIEIDPFATISNVQNMANGMFRKTADYIAEQKRLAREDFQNRHVYIDRAEKAKRNYSELSTAFGNKDFIEKAQTKFSNMASGFYFLDSDYNDRMKSIEQGMVDWEVDENSGELKFILPKNGNAKDDDPAIKISVGEVLNLYGKDEEVNLLDSNKLNGNNGFIDKILPEVAKTMFSEYSNNTDGITTKSGRGFDKKRAEQWFDNGYGVYTANSVPVELQQYSKRYLGKRIENEEDYKKTRKAIVDYIGSLVPKESGVNTRLSKEERDNLKADTRVKNKSTEDGHSNAFSGHVTVDDGKGGTVEMLGAGITKTHKDGVTESFVYRVTQKSDGTGPVVTPYIGHKQEDGRIVYKTPMSDTDADVAVRRLGGDPKLLRRRALELGEDRRRKRDNPTSLGKTRGTVSIENSRATEGGRYESKSKS